MPQATSNNSTKMCCRYIVYDQEPVLPRSLLPATSLLTHLPSGKGGTDGKDLVLPEQLLPVGGVGLAGAVATVEGVVGIEGLQEERRDSVSGKEAGTIPIPIAPSY